MSDMDIYVGPNTLEHFSKKYLGDPDNIKSLGDGTVTGAIKAVSEKATSNENSISSLTTKVNNQENSISQINTDLSALSSKISKRGVLIIGDSYGTGYTITGSTTTPYTSLLKTRLSAAGITNYWYSCKNGAGFVASETGTFLQTLNTWISGNSGNLSKVTDVYIIGGLNDKNANASNLSSAIQTFATRCRAVFPNLFAIYLVPVACSITPGEYKSYKNNVVHRYNSYAGACGCVRVPNTEYILLEASNIIDGIHPTNSGQTIIANALASVIIGRCGCPDIMSEKTDNITLNSAGFDRGSGQIYYRRIGGSLTVEMKGSFHIANSVQMTPTGYALGTVPRSYPIEERIQIQGFIQVPVITTSWASTVVTLPATLSITPKDTGTMTLTLGYGMGYGYTFQDAANPGNAIGSLSGDVGTYFNTTAYVF